MAIPALAIVPDDESVSCTFDELTFKRDLNESICFPTSLRHADEFVA
jgi:hypothetical protein